METDNMFRFFSLCPRTLCAALVAAVLLAACNNNDSGDMAANVTQALQAKVQTIVVIYAENQSFDKLYATFPGANGIPGVHATATGAFIAQRARDAGNTVLAKLPQTWRKVTAPGH